MHGELVTNNSKNVKILRANGIIQGTVVDDLLIWDKVHQFSSSIIDDVCMPNDLNILSEKVRAHHERSYSRSYAELKSRYFANPWITISVVAGILLFVLTFIQTIYGTLNYYKQ